MDAPLGRDLEANVSLRIDSHALTRQMCLEAGCLSERLIIWRINNYNNYKEMLHVD